MKSPSNNMVEFTVQELRPVGEMQALCGLRRIDHDDPMDSPFVLAANPKAIASIGYQLESHLQSDNYDEATTRIVGVIVGDAGPLTLFRGNSDELIQERILDSPILFVEVAGLRAVMTERTRFDDQILMYEPEEVRLEREKHPWWKFW